MLEGYLAIAVFVVLGFLAAYSKCEEEIEER